MASGDEELAGNVVPFGKYKDRPVTDLAADSGYRDWCLSQPWFADRYPVIYQILVQGAPPPQDSPEHNEMQARFLDDDWCPPEPPDPGEPDKPVLLSYPPYPYPYPRAGSPEHYRQQLVTYQAQLDRFHQDSETYPQQLAEYEADLLRWKDAAHYADYHKPHDSYYQVQAPSVIAAELKPDLGDDYPTVLRQVQRYLTRRVSTGYGRYEDIRIDAAAFLVARRAQFTSVTLDQVRKIFSASGIALVLESEIAGAWSWIL